MLAFIYTFAQDNRGKKAHFIILQIPVEFLPWAMLTLTFIMGGPTAALQQGMGVVGGSSLRCSYTTISNIPRRSQLHPDSKRGKALVWSGEKYFLTQGVWYEL